MLPAKKTKKPSLFSNLFASPSLDEEKKEEKLEITNILFLGSNEKISQTLFDITRENKNLYKKNNRFYYISVLSNIEDSLFLAK